MHAKRNLVSFIGLGSRTVISLLYAYIKEHPAVCLPEVQSHFFSDAKQYAKGLAWYEALFVTDKKHTVCGELALNYLHNGQAAQLIARAYPNAKLVAVIEDPLLCVRMEYVQALTSGMPKNISIAEFIKRTPEVLLRAKFGRLLVPYFSYYSNTDLLVLTASDIVHDPLPIIKKTYEHCGLDSSFVPLSLRHLVIEEEDDGKKRPGIIKRTYKRLKSVVRFIVTRIAQKLFPPTVPEETVLDQARRVVLPTDLEVTLKEYYREDVATLSALLHRDFNVEWSI